MNMDLKGKHVIIQGVQRMFFLFLTNHYYYYLSWTKKRIRKEIIGVENQTLIQVSEVDFVFFVLDVSKREQVRSKAIYNME